MAIKIKKKRPEDATDDVLAQADQVLVATQETFGWLTDNRNLVLGLIAGGIVVITVASLAWDARKEHAIREARPVIEAIALAAAPVGDDAAFASGTERAEATAEAAAAVSNSGLARLVEGSARLELGDAEAAIAAYEAAGAALSTTEHAVVAFGMAAAKAESGDLAGALTVLDTVEQASPDLAPVASLQAARLVDAFDTDAAAIAAYREHLTAHPDGPGRTMVENRVAQLAIALGEEPAAEVGDAADE